MTPIAAIIKKLGETAGVTNIVAGRIYSVSGPDGASDAHVIIQQIGADPGESHVGATGATDRLFQFACFAPTATDARALRDAVVSALDGVTLDNGDNPTLEDERDGDDDDHTKLFRADADFLV